MIYYKRRLQHSILEGDKVITLIITETWVQELQQWQCMKHLTKHQKFSLNLFLFAASTPGKNYNNWKFKKYSPYF